MSGTNTNEQGARLIRHLQGERMGEVSGLDIIFPRIFSALQGYDGGDEGIRTLETLPGLLP